MRVGEVIRLAREQEGLSLRDLEERTGLSNPLISQIETGHVKDPGFATVVRLARSLHLSIDLLAATVDLTVPEKPAKPPRDERRATGGHARAAALSPERRREIARHAAQTRWAK